MSLKEQARQWLKGVVSKHVASNARAYSFTVYCGEANVSSALGFQIDLSPQEGKVVDGDQDWLLLKTARSKFFVCAKSLLETQPSLGDTVRITPYARRGFDGRRLDEPREEDRGDGLAVRVMVIGENVSRLPIDKKSLQSEYLKDMIDQVERMPAKDGIRKLGQVLVDAGAYLEKVCYKDPLDEDIIAMPPTLQFRVKTDKHDGYLNIVYDRALDLYRLDLVEYGSRDIVGQVDMVDLISMPGVIADLVDDGKWRIAKVEVLKPAPKKLAKVA